jgi:hypothetical protein
MSGFGSALDFKTDFGAKETMHSTDISIDEIEQARRAFTFRPAGHPDRLKRYGYLSRILGNAHKAKNRINIPNECIAIERDILEMLPSRNDDRAQVCCSPAISLRASFLRTSDISIIDRVISLERQALGLRPPGHEDRAISCWLLALSLKMRCSQVFDGTLLEEAIHLTREARAISHQGPDDSPWNDTLVQLLLADFQQTGHTTPSMKRSLWPGRY